MTDHYYIYRHVLPQGKHIATKRQTVTVEGYNSVVRQYLARMHRRTKCYSKSIEMLYLSVLLLMAKWNDELSVLF